MKPPTPSTISEFMHTRWLRDIRPKTNGGQRPRPTELNRDCPFVPVDGQRWPSVRRR